MLNHVFFKLFILTGFLDFISATNYTLDPMTTHSGIEHDGLLSPVVSNVSPSILRSLRRILLTSLLISLIWLPGFSGSAHALPSVKIAADKIAPQMAQSPFTASDQMNALITCLPKQLSQPSLKRALSEMGNDQLERAFNLKSNPRLSSAEIELNSCMSRKGFTA